MCSTHDERCLIPPSPEARERIKARLEELRSSRDLVASRIRFGEPDRPGFNDGLIVPGDSFPLGTPLDRVRRSAIDRAPLRGAVRVAVILVDFDDRPMSPAHDVAHFEQLFFSRNVMPKGSVRDYFAEVSNGGIEIVGEVVGPFRMPLTLAQYANGDSGTGNAQPNARTMARHAAERANPSVDFGPYDNDGNGFVDAFIVVHAGAGAESTLNAGDIWSHKWVLPTGAFNADGTSIFAYLTVPEDARIGVCCHELGHLLFGWPDLYDTDGSSDGLGNWCLMAGGSWNDNGDIPAHPSAWCKAQQGWVTVTNHTANGPLRVEGVATSRHVHRLWKDGASSREYFLVENRERKLFDRRIPGEGLLIYHVDENVATNSNERHPKVRLLQADGATHLDRGANRGDDGDCYPGRANNRTWNATSSPGSKSYGGVSTEVSLTKISDAGPVMTAQMTVRGTAAPQCHWWPFHFNTNARGIAAAAGPNIGADATSDLERSLMAIEGMISGGGDTGSSLWRSDIERRLGAIESLLAMISGTGGAVSGTVVPMRSTDEGGATS